MGLTASSAYSVSSSIYPGTNLFTRAYDQAGNYATCDASGNIVGTSDLVQAVATITEDVTLPTIGTINIPPGNKTITASWSGSDDQTPANQINYAYTVDVPFDQWDDPNVTIVGAQTSATIDVSTMTEGQHTFYLIALDQEGNIGSASQSFTVNRTPLHIALYGNGLTPLPDKASGSCRTVSVDADDWNGDTLLYKGLGSRPSVEHEWRTRSPAHASARHRPKYGR